MVGTPGLLARYSVSVSVDSMPGLFRSWSPVDVLAGCMKDELKLQ